MVSTRIAATLMAAMVLGAMGAAAAQAPDPAGHDSGAYLFRVFCASCHGPSGAGDGPVALVLRQRPTDLTAIARTAGGTFPRERVVAAIDGRSLLVSHGTREMPVWGDRLKVTEGPDEPIIRKRIEALATYIESIQVKKP